MSNTLDLKKCPAMKRIAKRKVFFIDDWQDLFLKIYSLWDATAPSAVIEAFKYEVSATIYRAKLRIIAVTGNANILQAYIYEWRKFYAYCNLKYVKNETSFQRFMLNTWTETIFSDLSNRLQKCSMKLITEERSDKKIDSRIIIALRECYINLCTNSDKLFLYREHFETPYIVGMKTYYTLRSSMQLEKNGFNNYTRFATKKIKEEEERGVKYLRQYSDAERIVRQNCVDVLNTAFRESIFVVCVQMVVEKETEKLYDILRVFYLNPEEVVSLVDAIEQEIATASTADMIAVAAICSSTARSLTKFY